MTPPGGYRRRIVDSELDFLIANLFAVAIDGPKAVGKTATAEQRAATVHRLDTDPLDLIEADPSRLTDAPEPILIDEWQHWPPSWDFVRRAVDDDPRPGRFILTGSTSLRNPQTHSGAGRIVSLRMRPLTLPERGEVSPAVSLADLLSVQAGKITGDTPYELEDYTEQIVGGGFPGMHSLTTAAKTAQLDGYIRRIVERDFPEAGKDVRNPAGLLRWMRAFAAATSTTATFETIRDAAATGHANPPARSTTIPYRDALEGIWISDPVPAWHPIGVRIDRLTEGPKHNLADPALAAALLGASAGSARLCFGPSVSRSIRTPMRCHAGTGSEIQMPSKASRYGIVVERAGGLACPVAAASRIVSNVAVVDVAAANARIQRSSPAGFRTSFPASGKSRSTIRRMYPSSWAVFAAVVRECIPGKPPPTICSV